ncbi:arginine deiminase [Egicoccus halophilus]|uniref:Arginine deiminase n=1 Tax=Egicoccus halophilus TaxID=1670830 RepID=A0A8J3EUL5_9ACTN|nr:arginine deiminase [Egicoccus halophilus]GGI06121.1 arginine deiminase [Egicoccus halophilus]
MTGAAPVETSTPVTAPSVRSEVGQLRTVLLHRPGTEVERITPSNMDQLLFDELLWVEHAQAEHDAFADVLRGLDVEVLYVEALLAEVVADDAVARRVVERHVTERDCGPQAVGRIRDLLLDNPPAQLVEHLIGGVSVEEVGPGDGLVTTVSGQTQMLLQPLPNAVFTRDSSAWIGEGVVLSPMNRLVRRRETDLLRTVYSHHPRFAEAPIWFGGEGTEWFPATFEGGDLLVVGERGLAVGMSERTTPAGVEALATRLFEAGVVDRVLAVDLPKVRAAMHLDTIVTQVDVDAFITYPTMTASLRAYAVTPRPGGGLHVAEHAGFLQGLAWAAGLDHARAIEPALGSIRAEREQWNDANNTLAVRPGVVVAYERNVATNEILDTAGIEVHTIPSYELPRGRGGPRCMSCPVARDPLVR